MLKNNKLKSRKQLPAFLKLRYKFDINKILHAFKSFQDYQKYTDLEPQHQNCAYKSLCIARKELHEKFLSPQELKKNQTFLSSQQYRQLSLTKYNGPAPVAPDTLTDTEKPFISYRRTSRKKSIDYESIFDERNYTKRNSRCVGYLNTILDTFVSQVTRTRFAYLAPYSVIQPHIDYNTTYSIRIHIPIITNKKSFLCVKEQNGRIHKFHAAADGNAYFMNTGLNHWAENNGHDARVHLIVSINGQDDLDGSYEL